ITHKNDKKSPIIADLRKLKSPHATKTAATNDIPIIKMVESRVFSLKTKKTPAEASIACKASIIVELATVVNSNDLNHNAKCIPRNKPEKPRRPHCFCDIFLNSSLFIHTTGNRNKHAIYMRYILSIVAGAADDFTNIAANDMAMIEIINENVIGGVLLFFRATFPLLEITLLFI